MSPSGPSNWLLGNGLSGDRMRRGTIRLQTLNYQLNHFSVKRSSLLFDVNYTPQRETKLNVAEMGAQRRGLCFRLPVSSDSSQALLLHVRRLQMRKRV
ncbi:hypothetical protein E4U17_007324 [Claviceps sp. LM77 group G4]|nr:hypothetical protein E4U17_007324 [Claviceps sp. LM77 group G4]KAG6062764.1 hypothetical protein E4U33_006461 [Claviceps sp. LM78 group G4]KAG6072163.1 hypothetical protein E4U16_005589 [Claviceps sp. LM84 group G4]